MKPSMGLHAADRLYYNDSFLASFDATVTDIRLVSRSGTEALWQIALDRSAFYPTSGGQPCDRGTLTATSRAGAVLEVPIDEVREDEAGEVWHFTSKPLVAGTPVRASIDWRRRLDHMQQHSGQHLLSAIFSRELGANTVSFHLGEETSTIDLATASIADATLERVETLANEAVAEERSFSVHSVTREEAEGLLAAGRLRKLPEREGDIRLVEIEGIDLNACGGTHVRSTGQIGGIALRSTEKVRNGLRVEFVCGLRAVAAARREFALSTAAAAVLSVGKGDLLAAIQRLQAELKQGAKERQKLRDGLAQFEAAQLISQTTSQAGFRVIRRQFAEHDAEYVKLLASKLVTDPATVALLASTRQEPASVVIARGAALKFSCGESIKKALETRGLRGGGSPTLAQGQIGAGELDGLLDELEAAIRKAVGASF
jgi:alanyl-tRNA synthetase